MARFKKPVAFVVRPALAKEATEAVFAFQEEAAARGLATFASVSRAARALRRVLDWQAGQA
jgi:hypothetical protein